MTTEAEFDYQIYVYERVFAAYLDDAVEYLDDFSTLLDDWRNERTDIIKDLISKMVSEINQLKAELNS